MLSDALQLLFETARDADSLEVETHPGAPEVVFIREGKNYRTITTPPPRRAHEVHSIAALVSAATDDGMGAEPPDPEVFHCARNITMFPYRKDRRDRFTMPLETSAKFRTLVTMEREYHTMTVLDAVKFLRFDLGGHADVEAHLEKVDFTRMDTARAGASHGDELMSREVEDKVQQRSTIPKEFTIVLAPYINPGINQHHAKFRVGIYLDIQDKGIQFRTLPDETDLAIAYVQELIGVQLAEELPKAAIFHGSA